RELKLHDQPQEEEPLEDPRRALLRGRDLAREGRVGGPEEQEARADDREPEARGVEDVAPPSAPLPLDQLLAQKGDRHEEELPAEIGVAKPEEEVDAEDDRQGA